MTETLKTAAIVVAYRLALAVLLAIVSLIALPAVEALLSDGPIAMLGAAFDVWWSLSQEMVSDGVIEYEMRG